MCRICNHPDGTRITEQVLKGDITLYKAAKILGVGYHEIERHIYEHVIEPPKKPKRFENFEDMLRDIINRLYGIIYKLSLSTDTSDLKVLSGLIRELRETVKTLSDVQSEWSEKGLEKLRRYEETFEELIDVASKLPSESRDQLLSILQVSADGAED